jgi:hypothetical protein
MGSQKKILLSHKIIKKLKKYGLIGFSKLCVLLVHRILSQKYYLFINSKAERYQNPDIDELSSIERDLLALGVPVESYEPDPDQFQFFLQKQ